MFASRMQIFMHIFNVSLCNDTHADGVYTRVLFLSRSEDRAMYSCWCFLLIFLVLNSAKLSPFLSVEVYRTQVFITTDTTMFQNTKRECRRTELPDQCLIC